jgi:tRNA pseudouridine13 synthase
MPAGSSINTSTDLPRLCADLPVTGGRLRAEPADFTVDEIAQYLPSGEGQHMFLRVEKTMRTTEDVVQWLYAKGFREVGTAGKKDKAAVTRQWISVERKLWREELVQEVPEGVRILEAKPHANKLKTGHLRGNRFAIRVRGAQADPAVLAQAGERIGAQGLPNYFGDQRFGRAHGNAAEGLAVLRGERRLPKNKAKFLISALQSELFNRYLAARMRTGTWRRVLPGDVLKKTDSGGLFTSTDAAADQPRLDARELAPAGPLFGPEMPPAGGEARALEQRVLAEAGLGDADFARSAVYTTGSRRALIVYPEDVACEVEAPDTFTLRFTLPKGSYATVLLREYTGDEPAAHE